MLMLLPVIVTLCGVYFLFKLRFFFILHPIKTISSIIETLRKREARLSLSLALAGTLGVGNIVGVAVGIMIGGAGSVFWLFISSLFAAVIKFAESTLSNDSGAVGMMPVISKAFGRARLLPRIYAFSALLLSLFMGASLQTNSVVSSATHLSSLGRYSVVPFAALVIAVVIFGAEGVKRVTAIVIPIATATYVIICSAVIFARFYEIPCVLNNIFSSAFTVDATCGGALGFLCSAAIREGYARGLLSNEAGAGTSALAHTDTQYPHPTVAGLIGMCEVLFDTVILCMLTAFAILLSTPDTSAYTTGISLVLESVGSVLGKSTYGIVLSCIFAFAFSTVICWYSYGTVCFSYLFRGHKWIYTLLFLLAVFSGAFLSDAFLIRITDYVLLVLTAISAASIIKCSDRVLSLSEHSGLVIRRRRL